MIRSNLLLMTMAGTFAFNFTVVLPLMAKVTFEGDAKTVSLLFTVQGAGALAGAFIVASLRRTDGRRIVIATAVLGTTIFVGAIAPSLTTMLLILPFLGCQRRELRISVAVGLIDRLGISSGYGIRRLAAGVRACAPTNASASQRLWSALRNFVFHKVSGQPVVVQNASEHRTGTMTCAVTGEERLGGG